MHRSNPDEICAMCDEFTLKQAEPAKAATGQGLCLVAEQGRPLHHVDWHGRTCVSFRLDRENLTLRRQYVAQQRGTNATTEEGGEQ
jgi:hypothetical protein